MRSLVYVSLSRQKSCTICRIQTSCVVLDGGFSVNSSNGACKHTEWTIHEARAALQRLLCRVWVDEVVFGRFPSLLLPQGQACCSHSHGCTSSPSMMAAAMNTGMPCTPLWAHVASLSCGVHHLMGCYAERREPIIIPTVHHHRPQASMLSQPTMAVPLHHSLSH
jgi:hypothetical protein